MAAGMPQVPPNVFELNHEVTIEYPCKSLLVRGEEEPIFCEVDHPEARYDPSCPLVDDVSVANHQCRENIEESGIYYYAKADYSECRNNPLPERVSGSLFEFLQDMRIATRHHGSTRLDVMTYMSVERIGPMDGGEGDRRIRIRRETNLQAQDDNIMTDSGTYDMPMNSLCLANPQLLLRSILVETIGRMTDHAWRHVQVRAQMQGLHEIEPTNWKPPRRPDVEAMVKEASSKVEITALDPDSRACSVCTEDFGPEREALRLACNHVFCKQCVVRWSDVRALGAANCAYCRAPLLDEARSEAIIFGVTGKAYYMNPHFNIWENFERSLADLDKYLASNNNSQINFRSDLAKAVTIGLFEGAKLEPASSTPMHMQLARRPEGEVMLDVVLGTIEYFNGRQLPTDALFDSIRLATHSALYERFCQAGQDRFLSGNEKAEMIERPEYIFEFLPPGSGPFLDRMLSRLLQFFSYRRCEACEYYEGRENNGLHSHGLRQYYCRQDHLLQQRRLIEDGRQVEADGRTIAEVTDHADAMDLDLGFGIY